MSDRKSKCLEVDEEQVVVVVEHDAKWLGEVWCSVASPQGPSVKVPRFYAALVCPRAFRPEHEHDVRSAARWAADVIMEEVVRRWRQVQ
jgi:hypothetical protein